MPPIGNWLALSTGLFPHCFYAHGTCRGGYYPPAFLPPIYLMGLSCPRTMSSIGVFPLYGPRNPFSFLVEKKVDFIRKEKTFKGDFLEAVPLKNSPPNQYGAVGSRGKERVFYGLRIWWVSLQLSKDTFLRRVFLLRRGYAVVFGCRVERSTGRMISAPTGGSIGAWLSPIVPRGILSWWWRGYQPLFL